MQNGKSASRLKAEGLLEELRPTKGPIVEGGYDVRAVRKAINTIEARIGALESAAAVDHSEVEQLTAAIKLLQERNSEKLKKHKFKTIASGISTVSLAIVFWPLALVSGAYVAKHLLKSAHHFNCSDRIIALEHRTRKLSRAIH